MATALIVFLLFFLPFVALPFGVSPFEAPKVIIAEIAIGLLLVVSFFRHSGLARKHSVRALSRISKQMFLVISLIILTLIDLALFRSSTSFFGNPFRLQGIFLLWHLLVLFLVSSNIKIDKIPSYIYPISLTLLLITTIVFGGNENGRAIGTLGEPNALAAVAVFILPFAFFKQNSFIKIVGFASTLIIIFLSGSRSGLIALAIMFLFILINKGVRLSIAKSFLLSLIFLIFSFSLPVIEGGGWFENRSVIWQTALAAGFRSPIIGNGFGNIDNALHETSIEMKNLVQHQFIDSSHNIFLDFWVQGGIVGLTALIGIISLSIKNLIAQSKTLELTALLGLLTVMSFNPVSVVTLVAFWWIVGQGFMAQGHSRLLPKGGSG